MNGIIVKDWRKIDLNTPEGRAKNIACVQNFFNKSEEERRKIWTGFKQNIQNFTTSSNFPTSVLPVEDKYRLSTYFDLAYEEVFEQKDMRTSERDGVRIQDVTSTITFEKVAEGNRAKVYSASGTEVTVKFDMYGGGIQWSQKLIDDREYWTIEDNTFLFRNAYYSGKAANHFALIEAATANTVSWQNPVPSTLPNTADSYVVNRDIQTINKGAQDIFDRCKNKGFGINPMTPLVLLTPLALWPRYNAALRFTNQAYSSSPNGIIYNIRMVPTAGFTASTHGFLCLPGMKNKMYNRMDLTVFNKFDESYYGQVMYGWSRYGAAINTDQISRLATS